MKAKIVSVLSAAALVFALCAAPASADTFTLDMGNSALSGYPGPYGTVNVTWNNSTSATVVFTSDTVGTNVYSFMDGGSADLNVNASSFTSAFNSCTSASWDGGSCSFVSAGSGNVSSFGSFNFVSTFFDGFDHAATSISFTLNNTSGTWGSAADVLTPNSDGHSVAAHVAVCSSTTPCSTTSGALATGFASDGSNTPVPEPGSLALFGTGALGIAAFLKRKLLA